MELAKTMAADQDIVICLSGRGDKGIVNSQSTLLTSQMFKALLKNFLGSVRKLAGIFGFSLDVVGIIIREYYLVEKKRRKKLLVAYHHTIHFLATQL
jgi:hypothetical protein